MAISDAEIGQAFLNKYLAAQDEVKRLEALVAQLQQEVHNLQKQLLGNKKSE